MKPTILFAMFTFLGITLFAQNSRTDETAIKNIIKQQEAQWNQHDWDAFSSYYTGEATLINFVGEYCKGRRDITAHFKLLNDCCLEPTSLKFDCKTIKFLTPEIAIVYIEETLFANRDYEVPFRQYKKGETENYDIIFFTSPTRTFHPIFSA